MSLSGWWAGSTHRALDGVSDMARRLALVLGPVRATVRVIDDNVPAMPVGWATVRGGKSGSYTDFSRGGRIRINPLPVMENKLPAGEQVDLSTGFGLHEAAHGKHSRDRAKHLTKRRDDVSMVGIPAFEPLKVAIALFNIAEDVRIEEAVMRDWRGTRPYFAKVREWVWSEREREIDEDAPESPLAAAIDEVFVACRFPEHAPASEDTTWWQAWLNDYITDRTDVPTTIQRGLDRLARDHGHEMQEQTDKERAERKAGEALWSQLERLAREVEQWGGCVLDGGEFGGLDRIMAADVNRLVAEGLVRVRPILPYGDTQPAIDVRKPVEDDRSREAYVGTPDAAVEALRAAIVFRPESPRTEVKLQKSGELDEEELWRFATGERRLFAQHLIESRPDVALGLLVDMSGSMTGMGDEDHAKIDIAQRLAQLFVWAFHDERGVSTTVWGHTDARDVGTVADIYRLWEQGDPLSRLGLISSMRHGENYDSFAIGFCADRMREMPEPQKVLFVLSDGLPAGFNYGGIPAMNHVRATVDWARKQGVEVIQIAIDTMLRPDDQARMFGNSWVPYTDERTLFRDLTRLMLKVTQ